MGILIFDSPFEQKNNAQTPATLQIIPLFHMYFTMNEYRKKAILPALLRRSRLGEVSRHASFFKTPFLSHANSSLYLRNVLVLILITKWSLYFRQSGVKLLTGHLLMLKLIGLDCTALVCSGPIRYLQ